MIWGKTVNGALNKSEDAPESARRSADSNQRAEHRHRVLKSAHASFNDKFSAVACVVHNVSESGAKVDFNDFGMIPRTFTLYVDLDGYKVECERVWQEGKSCGVRFIGEKIPIKVFRTQVLRSSENALSESTVREIETREHDREFVAQRESNNDSAVCPEEPRRAAHHRPTFGKRS